MERESERESNTKQMLFSRFINRASSFFFLSLLAASLKKLKTSKNPNNKTPNDNNNSAMNPSQGSVPRRKVKATDSLTSRGGGKGFRSK